MKTERLEVWPASSHSLQGDNQPSENRGGAPVDTAIALWVLPGPYCRPSGLRPSLFPGST